jgi:hypothetical protein
LLQLKESSISKECVDVKSVDGMLSKMKKTMKKSLLFLANVRKISISYIDQNNLISGTSTVLYLHTRHIRFSYWYI